MLFKGMNSLSPWALSVSHESPGVKAHIKPGACLSQPSVAKRGAH